MAHLIIEKTLEGAGTGLYYGAAVGGVIYYVGLMVVSGVPHPQVLFPIVCMTAACAFWGTVIGGLTGFVNGVKQTWDMSPSAPYAGEKSSK